MPPGANLGAHSHTHGAVMSPRAGLNSKVSPHIPLPRPAVPHREVMSSAGSPASS